MGPAVLNLMDWSAYEVSGVFNKSNYYREFEINRNGNYFNMGSMNQIVTDKSMILNFYYSSFLLMIFFMS